MFRLKINAWDFIYWSSLIIVDLIVYLFLGMLQMSYDDHYSESKGIYGSWESMSTNEQTYHVAFLFWNLVNLIVLLLLARKAIGKLTKKHQG